MKKEIILTVILFFLLLVVDQLSKYFFYDLQLFHSSLYIEPILNEGISFGLLLHDITVLIVSITVFVFGFILWLQKKISSFIAVFFLAGLVGNLIDRLFLGGVRDFLVFGDLFIFNVADVYLNVAIVVLLIEEFAIVFKKSHIGSGKKQ